MDIPNVLARSPKLIPCFAAFFTKSVVTFSPLRIVFKKISSVSWVYFVHTNILFKS